MKIFLQEEKKKTRKTQDFYDLISFAQLKKDDEILFLQNE